MPGRRRREAGPCRQRNRRGMRLVLRPALLLLLAEGKSHGYDLMEQIEALGLDRDCLDSSVLYRDLREMEEMGLLQSAWDDDSKGPRRRVYQINQEGMDWLGFWMENLSQIRAQIEMLQARFQRLVPQGDN